MISIKNKNNLKFWYEILKAIETKLTKNTETIIEIKKAIRFYIHQNNDITIYNHKNRKLIVQKIPDIWTKDLTDMIKWFYKYEYQEYNNDNYGQWFTFDWKIAKKGNKYYLYHLLYIVKEKK